MRTILIVDDHAGFRLQARALLEAEGFLVIGEAADGASGLRIARALGPDVVLLDVGLPDLDGFEVANQLSRDRVSPVIILTSSNPVSEYGLQLAAGRIGGFIAKEDLSGDAIRTFAGQS